MEEDTITIDSKTKKPILSEELCSGCGICTNRCPFNAVSIINLPEALDDPIHRYGQNLFELFGLPNIKEGFCCWNTWTQWYREINYHQNTFR